jgi:hypothetical protein
VARAARRARRQAEVAGLLLVLALAGCANLAAPPGGPPDSTPPHIVVVHPESGAVVADLKGDAVIRFDELIDEMGGGGGAGGGGAAAGLGRQIVLSPVAGDVHVSWHRTSIRIKPAEGWKPGRVYHLQVLPGITDLRHNIMKQGATVIFSTGPALPHAALSGTVLQWSEQRALGQAVVRAALLPDTVAYVTVADSGGAFSFTGIPPGRYRVYAIQDQNSNRRLDPREGFDSTTVALDSSASAVLWTFAHDTLGPRLRGADPIDTVAFRLWFSQPLDPSRTLDTTRVHLFALPDTTPVALTGIWTATQFDSIGQRERAVADSLRRAKDTTAAAPAAVGRDTTARADTSRIRQLLRQRPVPSDRFVARAAKALTPGHTYLVRVHAATNLSGAAADAAAALAIPVPKPPPAHRDTTRANPGARPPRPPRPP